MSVDSREGELEDVVKPSLDLQFYYWDQGEFAYVYDANYQGATLEEDIKTEFADIILNRGMNECKTLRDCSVSGQRCLYYTLFYQFQYGTDAASGFLCATQSESGCLSGHEDWGDWGVQTFTL